MATLLPPPAPLALQKMKHHGRTWKQFKQSWLNYSIASEVNEKEENVKVAMFLHVAREEAMEKYKGFLWENEDDKNNLNKIIEKFDELRLQRTVKYHSGTVQLPE